MGYFRRISAAVQIVVDSHQVPNLRVHDALSRKYSRQLVIPKSVGDPRKFFMHVSLSHKSIESNYRTDQRKDQSEGNASWYGFDHMLFH